MKDVFALMVLLSVGGSAAAAELTERMEFQRGLAAYNVDDYPTAAREFTAASERGDPAAQNNLGKMYAEGLGVERDYEKAATLYRLAAEKGEPRAQYNLGIAYDRGLGVAIDPVEATQWYLRAAEVGDAYAQNSFGVKLARGEGGVEQDLPRAYMWFTLAASRHPAGPDRDTALANRRLVERQMTPNQMAQAERHIRFWRPKRPEPLEYGARGVSPFKKVSR